MSYQNADCEGCPRHEFPYKAQNPFSGEKIEIRGKDDIETLLLEGMEVNIPRQYSLGQNLYFNLRTCICPLQLYDDWSQEQIKAFMYCKEFHISAFPGSYAEQPAWWLDASTIIRNEIAAIEKFESEKWQKKN